MHASLALSLLASAPHARSCEHRLDLRLLRRPPFLCRRLAREECSSFFVVLNPLSSKPLAKPCTWTDAICAAGTRGLCGNFSSFHNVNINQRNLSMAPLPYLSQSLALLEHKAAIRARPTGGAVHEALANAGRLLRRRKQWLKRVDFSHLGQPCTSRSPGDGRIAGGVVHVVQAN